MGLYGNPDKAQNSAIASAKNDDSTLASIASANAAAIIAISENVIMLDGGGTAIPTSDPGVAGEVWANSNVLTISAGA